MVRVIQAKPIQKLILNDVTVGVYETSSNIIGNWRTSWVMQLRRKSGRGKLPRGFHSKTSKPQKFYV